eukprot:scaffold282345_cov32-Tisochrysis_lutea.AAC.1
MLPNCSGCTPPAGRAVKGLIHRRCSVGAASARSSLGHRPPYTVAQCCSKAPRRADGRRRHISPLSLR